MHAVWRKNEFLSPRNPVKNQALSIPNLRAPNMRMGLLSEQNDISPSTKLTHSVKISSI